jgi:hypothetical protein
MPKAALHRFIYSWLKNRRVERAPERKNMKAFIITPHIDTNFDFSFVLEREHKWVEVALEQAQKVLESLWDNMNLGDSVTVKMELKELTKEEEARFIEIQEAADSSTNTPK